MNQRLSRDGLLEESILYYAPGTDTRTRIKHEIYYDSDGRVLTDAKMRLDGSRIRSGTRQPDGTYLVVMYYEDGTSPQITRKLEESGSPVEEEQFRRDGSLSSSTEHKRHRSITTSFSTSGIKTLRLTRNKSLSQEVIEYFDEKDEVVLTSVEHTNMETIARYFDADGKPLEVREFWTDRLFITIFDKGVPSFRQRWARSGGDDNHPEYTFDALLYLDSQARITRIIDFDDESLEPETIEAIEDPGQYWSSARIEVTLTLDGKIDRAVRRNGVNGSFSKDPIDKALLKSLTNFDFTKEHLTMNESRDFPPRPIPPLGHSDLDE